jgi:hypothetical protein
VFFAYGRPAEVRHWHVDSVARAQQAGQQLKESTFLAVLLLEEKSETFSTLGACWR